MARQRMVTRTILSTKATLLVVNVTTSEVSELTVTLSGALENPEQVEKKASKLYSSAETKVVAVKSFETVENLYGMTEDAFIAQAELLPPRPVKENTEEVKLSEPKKPAKKH